MALAFTPLKGVNKEDWYLHGDAKSKIRSYWQGGMYIYSLMALSKSARNKNQRYKMKYQCLNQQEFWIFLNKWKKHKKETCSEPFKLHWNVCHWMVCLIYQAVQKCKSSKPSGGMGGRGLAVKSHYISEHFQSTVASIVVFSNFTSTSTLLESWLIIYTLLAPKITEATIFIVIKCLIVTLIVHKSLMMKARFYMTICDEYTVMCPAFEEWWLYKWLLNLQNLWALVSILKQCLAFYYCNLCM